MYAQISWMKRVRKNVVLSEGLRTQAPCSRGLNRKRLSDRGDNVHQRDGVSICGSLSYDCNEYGSLLASET
eukprot:3147080-Pyramimonas_sp.AAC.1